MVHLVIINLKRRTDRWDKLMQHIAEQKDNLHFIESVHRLEAVEYFDEQNRSQPAKGCMLSHRNAVQLAKDQFWGSVLVVEDDVRFEKDAGALWGEICNELKTRSWGVLFGATVRLRPRDVFKASPHLLKLKSPDGILTGTHCMLYNSGAYDQIINVINEEIVSPFPYHLDLLLSSKLNTPQCEIYVAVPFLALFMEQDSSDVRPGRDTNADYANITSAHQLAKMFV